MKKSLLICAFLGMVQLFSVSAQESKKEVKADTKEVKSEEKQEKEKMKSENQEMRNKAKLDSKSNSTTKTKQSKTEDK